MEEINIRELAEIKGRIEKLGSASEDINYIKNLLFIAYEAIDSASNGIIITDLEGIITYVNPAFLKLFAYNEVSQVTGKDIFQLIPFTREHRLKQREESFDESEELFLKRNDGTSFHTEIHSSLIRDRDKKIIGRMFSFTNISKRKEALEKLALSEKQLRISNDTKDRIFSIIAHDLRSPIASLISFQEAIHLDGIDENEMKSFLERYFKDVNKIYDMLENLLYWARSHMDEIKPRYRECNVANIINDNISFFSLNAEEKKISLHYKGSDELPAFADTDIINIVIRNLLSNALKFTPPGGEITIKGREKGDYIGVSVTDNGVGLNAEDMKKILRPDQHFTTRGTKGEKGTGLGLMLCKEFVEKIGGTISVESEPGKGSTFQFTVPALTGK